MLGQGGDPRRPGGSSGEIRPAWRAGELLVDPCRGALWAVFGDLRRPRRPVRSRRRSRRRRGAFPGDLEPRVHAGRMRRPEQHPEGAAPEEHRYGQQPRAGGGRAAGLGQRVRLGSAPADGRRRRAVDGASLSGKRTRRREPPGHRRTRPGHDVPHGGRDPAVERGPGLRAPADASPRGDPRAEAGRRTAGHGGPHRDDRAGDGRGVPRAGRRSRLDPAGGGGGGGAVRDHVPPRDEPVRTGSSEGERGWVLGLSWRGGLQAARHLRLPARVLDRARWGGGLACRQRVVRPVDGGTTQPGQGRTEEGRWGQRGPEPGGRGGGFDGVRRLRAPDVGRPGGWDRSG